MEVFDHHQIAGRAFCGYVDEASAIRRNGQSVVIDFLDSGDPLAPAGFKRVEKEGAYRVLWGGCAKVVDALEAYLKVEREQEAIKYLLFRAASGRHTPDARDIEVPREIDEPSVGGFDAVRGAASRDLHGRPALCRHFPKLIVTASIRDEVNPLAILRPARDVAITGPASELANRTAACADNVDIGISADPAIEGRPGLVRRRVVSLPDDG